MKSTEYIEWDKLEQITFCLCRIEADDENQERRSRRSGAEESDPDQMEK